MADETPKVAKSKRDFDVIIHLRQAHEGGGGREPDPRLDVYSVWVKGHPICPPGKAYRVAYTGSEKVLDNEGKQVLGNLCFLFDTSGEYSGPSKKVHKADLAKIREAVMAWQNSPDAIQWSKDNAEEILKV